MLHLRSIVNSHEAREELARFNPEKATWLVSDLKSKFDINRRLLLEREFVPGEAVLRASELWRILLSRLRPDLQLVSREFILTMISDRLSKSELEWAKAPGVAQTAFDYMTQLMPVLSHPNGDEMIREWFKANEASFARWGRWYDLSVELWKSFLNEGYLAPSWASGVLVNEVLEEAVWNRPLIVDLGSELSQVEADLLLLLADRIDVNVFKPNPPWAKNFTSSLRAYEVIQKKLGIEQTESDVKVASKSTKPLYRKYTTMIGEVKDATAQVRDWLEAGVKPSDIAIVAPDIEAYWFSLGAYLKEEGVPVQKDYVRRAHSFPDVAQWLARLRLKTGDFNESDVELSLFANSKKLISYERFKTLYAIIYGRQDLGKDEAVSDAFAVDLDAKHSATRDEFIQWSLRHLAEETNFDRIESIYKKVFAECPQNLKFPVERWLAYIQQIAARVECRISDGNPDGISCIKLSSAEHSLATKMIVLGLSESALKQSGSTSILHADISSLANSFGFHLASEDQAKLEFEARWLIDNFEGELILTVPETDFSGAALAPSWLWIDGAREDQLAQHVTIPRATRWDELQASELADISQVRQWTPARRDIVSASLEEDFGSRPLGAFAVEKKQQLSPSRIEDYLDCPFVYAAKYVFKLSDQADLDLELDASRRGSLMHKIFELLATNPMRFDYSDEELLAKLEEARTESNLELKDDRFWPSLRAKHLDLAKRFLAYEKEYRARFPAVQTVAKEQKVEGYIRPATGELIREQEEGAIYFSGRIDRIDIDSSGNIAIFDYKSSNSSTSQYGSWIENNQIQLLLYAIAIENGLTSVEANPVMAALYYVARPFSRDQGFKVEGVSQELYDFPDRKKNRLDVAAKEKLFADAKTLVKNAVEGILAGRFEPKPRDPDLCGTCRWSAICRTPHLS